MSELILERRGTGDSLLNPQEWIVRGENAYQCRVWICPEEEGFSAHADRLSGVVSEGETIEETLENVRDAFQAVIQSYLESDTAIPWSDDIEHPNDALERWILVDA